MNKEKDTLLKRIANYLLINSSFTNNIGLYHGKTGIVLFFMHYSRYANNKIYEEYAGELLDDICSNIHDNMPVDFENGYSGIGWTILYLLENRFIQGDADDILSELDREIMKFNLQYANNKQIIEIGYYINYRVKISNNINKCFTVNYLNEYRKEKEKKCYISDFNITSIIEKYDFNDENIFKQGMGLKKGCSGVGLKIILS